MKTKRPLHLIFVCISNRVRSTFSEFLFPKMMKEKGERLADPERRFSTPPSKTGLGAVERVKVSSAGFIPQKLKDRLAKVHVSFPEPFYNSPMAETTRAALLKKGFTIPEEWRSKELTPEMVEDADLIITALPEQKEELITLYPKAQSKIFTFRDMAKWDGYLLFEDFAILPMDNTFWDYVEGNPDYGSKVISVTEEMLIRAFPNILKQLGSRK